MLGWAKTRPAGQVYLMEAITVTNDWRASETLSGVNN